MPGMTEICVFLAWIAGGFVSGVSGIGGAMVAFPFLAMLLPVHEAIALTCIVNMVMDICLASLHFRFCRVSALWPMLLASVPGSFTGLYILQICSGPVLQGAVGLLLVYYVYWQKTFRARGSIAHPRALGAVAGFGSGLLGTAIAFDGPPVGAYGLCMGWEPRVLLGTLGVFFVLRATVTLVCRAWPVSTRPRCSPAPCTARPASSWAPASPSPWSSTSPSRHFARCCSASSPWRAWSVWCGRWGRDACLSTAGCVPLGLPGWLLPDTTGWSSAAMRQGPGLVQPQAPTPPAPRGVPGTVARAGEDGTAPSAHAVERRAQQT